MNIVNSTVRAAVVAALLGGSMLAGTGSAHAALKDCDLGFVPDKPIVGVGSIIGSAWAQCDVPPEQHEMHLGLDIRRGGQWVGVVLESNHKIPGVARTPYTVKTQCEPGLWRVEAEAVGILQGHPFKYAKFSAERFVNADDCARGAR